MVNPSNSPNWSLKIIKGQAYIYSWQYRQKSERSPRKKQRYYWKYQGKYSKDNKFIKSLPYHEQHKAAIEYNKKIKQENEIQKEMMSINNREPFKSQKEAIMQVKNRLNRQEAWKKHQKKVRKIALKNLESNPY